MSTTPYPILRLKLTLPPAFKLQFLPAIPGSNAAAAAADAQAAAAAAQEAANTAVAATTNKVDKSGDVMTGFLTLNANPTTNLQAATKQYVDAHAGGIVTINGEDGPGITLVAGTNVTIDSPGADQIRIAASGGGGGGAPLGAEYITSVADATLTAERVLTDSASITWDRTTAGQIKANTAAGGGNVSNSGTPTAGQYGKWVTATTIQGVAPATVLSDIGAQPLDADLTSIAGASVTNQWLYRSAANTWSPVTIGANLTFSGGTLAATGGGGGAPLGAEYITSTADPTLTSERVLTDSATIVWDRSTAGQIKAAAGGGFINVRTFTTSTTYTPTAGTQFAIVECVGGGGSGGCAQADASSSMQGGGGGSGGYSRSRLTAAQIGASQTITIGAGGATSASNGNPGSPTSFGSLCVANGGGGGGQAIVLVVGPISGAGATVGTGDIAIPGTPGGYGFYGQNNGGGIQGLTGNGGSGPLGSGGRSVLTGPGDGGGGYGGGGAGGSSHTTTAVVNGAAGAPGVVIVTEYNTTGGAQGPAGPVGGTTGPAAAQGRLTLLSGSPVMTTSQLAKTTLFYTPYKGNQLPLYDGTSMIMTAFAELSNVTTASSVNNAGPAAVAANNNYDLFVWNDAGTIRLTRGPAWTSDFVRSAGTALTNVNGLWLNAAAITNGPAIQRGTYVGTIRSDGAAQLNWKFGSAAVGGGQAIHLIWNCYNRVLVATSVKETTGSWTYAGASFRATQNSTNNSILLVRGLDEEAVAVEQYQNFFQGGDASTVTQNAVFLNGSVAGRMGFTQHPVHNATVASYRGLPGIGTHVFLSTESSSGGTATTFYGNGPVSQSHAFEALFMA